MSGIVALSAKQTDWHKRAGKIIFNRSFVKDLFLLTYYQQQAGLEFGGLATSKRRKNKRSIILRTHKELFRPAFQGDLLDFEGPLGIGHISDSLREPIWRRSAFGESAVCFSGNIINKEELIIKLCGEGYAFEPADSEANIRDVEVITKLIIRHGWKEELSQDDNFKQAISAMTEEIEGSYALVILTVDKIYVVRGPDGHEPLYVGKKKNRVVVVSETCGFFNTHFRVKREIEPGEIVTLKNGDLKLLGKIETKKVIKAQPCLFDGVYFFNPASQFFKSSVREFREGLGASLAKIDIENGFIPDVVIPVPASGIFHALGYKQEFDNQMNENKIPRIPLFDMDLIRYEYNTKRSFMPTDDMARIEEAIIKIIPIIDSKYAGRVLVVVDDSVVYGNQFLNYLVPKIRATRVKEIHVRIANPKIVGPCCYQKTGKAHIRLAAIDNRTGRIRTNEEIAKMLKVNSVMFNTCDDLARVAGVSLENLCVECDVPPKRN